jgi:hypothetical protein
MFNSILRLGEYEPNQTEFEQIKCATALKSIRIFRNTIY